MSTWRRGRVPHERSFKTVNEEWKAQWSDLLAWSTMFAVAIHAAVFAFWPSWDILDLRVESDLELLDAEIAWISFYDLPSSGGGGGVTASVALLEEPDSIPVGVDEETSIGGSALAGVAFSGGFVSAFSVGAVPSRRSWSPMRRPLRRILAGFRRIGPERNGTGSW